MKSLGTHTFVAVGMAAALVAASPSIGAAQMSKKPAGTHDMTGCLAKGSEAGTYKLTNVEGKGPKSVEIVEVASDVNLGAHVGHKVMITGTTVTADEAAQQLHESADQAKTTHNMRVTAVKHLSETCP